MLEAVPATEPLQVVDAQSDPLAVVSPQGAKEAEVFQEAVEATEEPPPTHKFEDDDYWYECDENWWVQPQLQGILDADDEQGFDSGQILKEMHF